MIQMADTSSIIVPTSVALLIVKDIGLLLLNKQKQKNGYNQRLTEEKVKIIIQTELEPVKDKIQELAIEVARIR